MALTLITGGARSGKSRFAEDLARAAGDRILYVATATAVDPVDDTIDPEMADRIGRHRARRPASWSTLEEPRHVRQAVAEYLAGDSRPPDALLLDCLTLLLSNWLMEDLDDGALMERAEGLAGYFANLTLPVIAVTNEVGLSLVPDNRLGRRFRDLAGLVNQCFAAASEEVYVLWSGIPVQIKPAAAQGR
ncbi:MAG: bifunctional adenosylcobinamide kinase/adenosylcobinamide-phosphate guanylyltransferase [Thermaerobacterales bacterium]